jgi:hypothetical protein
MKDKSPRLWCTLTFLPPNPNHRYPWKTLAAHQAVAAAMQHSIKSTFMRFNHSDAIEQIDSRATGKDQEDS